MSAPQKFVSKEALSGWMAWAAEKAEVYAPQREGSSVVYRAFEPGAVIELERRPTESAKKIIFPRCESLFTFSKQGEGDYPVQQGLVLQEAAEPGQSVVFCALSCDARGFLAFDPVYQGSGTQGLAQDTYYLKRRERCTLVVRACKTPLDTCFCNWVGGGPASEQGADVLAVDVEGGMALTAFSDKGKALLACPLLSDITSEKAQAAQKAGEAAAALMPAAPDLSRSSEALYALFGNAEFWWSQSAHCLSCGACTYLCPTCYCFNITDESNGLAGVRLRNWDTCMSPQFTLEASGHNPRQGKAARLKNRVGHKFAYYPKLHSGRFSCSGCGRCIKSCPSSVDIRKIVLDAIGAHSS
ncbi:4Fe-4S dicluster domain-containing protein [Desulfovibrio sp. OttesenSCG-928-F20]|nr:4Fe-4S dicluster domain-containing protein [Desulfovibrio sp. OttesenSCG-928-F20]